MRTHCSIRISRSRSNQVLQFVARTRSEHKDYKDLRYSTKSEMAVSLRPKDFFVLYVRTTTSSVGALPLWKYGGCCHSPWRGAVRYCLVALRDAQLGAPLGSGSLTTSEAGCSRSFASVRWVPLWQWTH